MPLWMATEPYTMRGPKRTWLVFKNFFMAHTELFLPLQCDLFSKKLNSYCKVLIWINLHLCSDRSIKKSLCTRTGDKTAAGHVLLLYSCAVVVKTVDFTNDNLLNHIYLSEKVGENTLLKRSCNHKKLMNWIVLQPKLQWEFKQFSSKKVF